MDRSYEIEIDKINKESSDIGRIDQKKSLELAKKAEVLSIYHNYNKGLGESFVNKGWYFLLTTDYIEARRQFEKAKKLFIKEKNILGLLKSNAGISGVFYHTGSYQDCFSLNIESIQLAKKNKLIDRILTAMVCNILVYIELNEFDEALKNAKEALELGEQTENFPQKPILLKSIADIYLKSGNKENYISYIKKSYELYKSSGEVIGESECLNSLGKYYYDLGTTEKAEGYLLKSVTLAKGSPLEDTMLYDLSHFYFTIKNMNKSIYYLKKSIVLAKELNSINCLKKCYDLLSKISEFNDEDDKAILYKKKSLLYEKELQVDISNKALSKLGSNIQINEVENENKKLERKNKVLNIITEISKKIISTLNPMELSSIIFKNISGLMDVSTFGLAYYDEVNNLLDFKIFIENNSNIDVGELSLEDKNSFACWSVRNKKDIKISDYAKESKKYIGSRNTVGLDTNSLIYMPIYYNNKVLALLTVQSVFKNAYSKEHIEILELIRPYISLAIKNTIEHNKLEDKNSNLDKSYKESKKLSYTDFLTGINNRRYFADIVNSQYLFKLDRIPVSFLFFDIDYFKVINVQHGYSVGDQLINELAKRVSSIIDDSKTFIRWGGEEFIILDRGSDHLRLKSFSDRLLKCVSSMPFYLKNKKVNLSISLGYLHIPRQLENSEKITWETCTTLAEKALALAKKSGRNCSVGYSLANGVNDITIDDEVGIELSEECLVTSVG